MAVVSMAERWVNEYCGQSFTGTIPDGVVDATLAMSKYLMNLRMKEDGYNKDFDTSFIEIELFCKSALQKNKVSIPYTSSSTDYNLPNREG
jgi:hypothetical protein